MSGLTFIKKKRIIHRRLHGGLFTSVFFVCLIAVLLTTSSTNAARTDTYTVRDENSMKGVGWHFTTDDRVHTWVITYTLQGAVLYGSEQDQLNWNFFSGFDAPVDTVEATVSLPGKVEGGLASIFTSGGHDYYIDRPDDRTFRFRVSDIAVGERVGIEVGWQKGLTRPNAPLRFVPLMFPYLEGVASILGPLLLCYLLWSINRRRRLQGSTIAS